MKVKIKRFDRSIPLPRYESAGAACVDLRARLETSIPPREVGYIPLNIAVEIPEGYWVMMAARGSTHKAGIMLVNGIGIFDWDFRGDNDEYHLAAYNFTDQPVIIEKGQRVAQMMIQKLERIEFEEVEALTEPDRGKFGSTGKD
jgi:dUTP pyrophosphatase